MSGERCRMPRLNGNQRQNRGADRGPRAGSPRGVVDATGPMPWHSGLEFILLKWFTLFILHVGDRLKMD